MTFYCYVATSQDDYSQPERNAKNYKELHRTAVKKCNTRNQSDMLPTRRNLNSHWVLAHQSVHVLQAGEQIYWCNASIASIPKVPGPDFGILKVEGPGWPEEEDHPSQSTSFDSLVAAKNLKPLGERLDFWWKNTRNIQQSSKKRKKPFKSVHFPTLNAFERFGLKVILICLKAFPSGNGN